MLVEIASCLRGIVLESHAIEYAQYAYLSTQTANSGAEGAQTSDARREPNSGTAVGRSHRAPGYAAFSLLPLSLLTSDSFFAPGGPTEPCLLIGRANSLSCASSVRIESTDLGSSDP